MTWAMVLALAPWVGWAVMALVSSLVDRRLTKARADLAEAIRRRDALDG